MGLVNVIKYLNKKLNGIKRYLMPRFINYCVILSAILAACETDRSNPDWFDEDILTIGQYLDLHQQEYSKFYRLLEEGELLSEYYP